MVMGRFLLMKWKKLIQLVGARRNYRKGVFWMKEVIAIIRMNMINKTRKALAVKGYNSLTCYKVKGRGKKKVNYELIDRLLEGEEIEEEVAAGDKIEPEVAESVSEGHRLIPKRLILMVVEDDDVDTVVETIMDVNQTGNPGDGKIFVKEVDNALRVRTEEEGEAAIK
jgi:nitrogen regulatory protein PII 2